MKQLDANTLVAYIDGELDTESATFVESLLAEDTEASRTAKLLQDSAYLIRAAHNHVIHETVPEHLVDTVMMAVESENHVADTAVPQHLVNMILDAPDGDNAASDRTAQSVSGAGNRSVGISMVRRRSVAAIASAAVFAAVMLGSGVLIGQYQLNGSQSEGDGHALNAVAAMDNPWREAAFQEALETKSSDSAVIWTNPETGYGGAIIPVKTYRRADGTFCRAFRTVDTNSSPEQPNYGVACREQGPQGRWIKTVEAVAEPGAAPKLSF